MGVRDKGGAGKTDRERPQEGQTILGWKQLCSFVGLLMSGEPCHHAGEWGAMPSC